MERWTVKDVMEHAKELKSPFDEMQKKPSIADRIKELLGKRK